MLRNRALEVKTAWRKHPGKWVTLGKRRTVMTLHYTKSHDLYLSPNFKPRFAVVFIINKSFDILFENIHFLDDCANH